MAELALKIGAGANYSDGDILAAFNSRFIRCVHAQHICHVKNAGGGVGALRDNAHVARDWFEHTHQYRFERVSRTEIKRANLVTLEEGIFTGPEFNVLIELGGGPWPLVPVAFPDVEANLNLSSRPSTAALLFVANGLGEVVWEDTQQKLFIDGSEVRWFSGQAKKEFTWVEDYVRDRLKHDIHKIFGTSGAEVWYGGRTDVRNPKMDLVWNAIETKTAFREVDYMRWPMQKEQPAQQIELTLSLEQWRALIAKGGTPPFEIKYFGADRQHHVANEGTVVNAILGGAESRDTFFVTIDEPVASWNVAKAAYEVIVDGEVAQTIDRLKDEKTDRFLETPAEWKERADEAVVVDLISPEIGIINPGTVDQEIITIKKRRRHIAWRDEIPTREHSDIEDKTVSVDLRETMTELVRDDVVRTRTLAVV